ncbi:unnamed protein product [Spirodela intermedia]|uniref:Uncharacterized protein n=1 Tax=Spirodela intermedia TaxID=51605 RepID=A0A7I8LLE8_SPIIN|nr:unnamed protein product [Spirodela intermedia]
MSQAPYSCPLFLKLEPIPPHILTSSPSGAMATKTQAMAAFLLLNLMFCPFASGQLPLTCLLLLPKLSSCGTLSVLIRLGITGILRTITTTGCCSLFTTTTSAQAIQCLCLETKLGLLSVSDVSAILTACNQPVPNPLCP